MVEGLLRKGRRGPKGRTTEIGKLFLRQSPVSGIFVFSSNPWGTPFISAMPLYFRPPAGTQKHSTQSTSAMPTMPTWFNPTTAELACYVTLRGPHFYAKTFFTSLVAATLCVDLLPLFVTGTSSYGAASKVCHDRFSPLRIAWYGDPESPYHVPDWDVDTEDSAAFHLFPQHFFNSISTAISLFGFWVWLFFGPHKSEQAKHLDRTCTTSACALFRDFNLYLSLCVSLCDLLSS